MANLHPDTGAKLSALPDSPVASPISNDCPNSVGNSATAAKGLKSEQVQALKAVPSAEKPPIPCKFLSATVTDPEGRKPGPDGSLYVVPPVAYSVKAFGGDGSNFTFSRGVGAASETVSAIGKFEGGCGKHPAWQLATGGDSKEQAGAQASLTVEVQRPERSLLPLNFPFTTSRMQAQACEGFATEYSIYAVAGDEVEFAFNTDAIKTPLKNTFTKVFSLETGRSKSEKKAELEGKFKLKQAWKEDKKTHRAYCETEISFSADPLFDWHVKGLAYGIYIPPKIRDYLRAGIFWSVEVNSVLTSNLVLWKWADTGNWQASEGGIKGELSLEGALSAELTLVDPEVCGVELVGKTSLKGMLGLRGEACGVRIEGKWEGLTASAKVSLFSGWVEIEKEWKCLDDIEPLSYDWPIESLFGPPPVVE